MPFGVDETPQTASASPPSSVTPPPTLPQLPPVSSSPSLPKPQMVGRSDKVIRSPVRFSD